MLLFYMLTFLSHALTRTPVPHSPFQAAVDEAKPAAEAPPSSAKKAKTELSASPKAAAPPLPKEAAPVKVEKSSKMDVEDDEEEEAKEPAPAPTQFAAYLSQKDKVVSKGAGTLKWVRDNLPPSTSCFLLLTRGHTDGAHRHPLLRGSVHPISALSGSVASYLICADVRTFR